MSNSKIIAVAITAFLLGGGSVGAVLLTQQQLFAEEPTVTYTPTPSVTPYAPDENVSPVTPTPEPSLSPSPTPTPTNKPEMKTVYVYEFIVDEKMNKSFAKILDEVRAAVTSDDLYAFDFRNSAYWIQVAYRNMPSEAIQASMRSFAREGNVQSYTVDIGSETVYGWLDYVQFVKSLPNNNFVPYVPDNGLPSYGEKIQWD